MTKNKNKIKNVKKPSDVYVLFNGRGFELIGTKIKFEIKIINFKF